MDLSALPVKLVMRWELASRLLASLVVPLLVGFLLNGDASGMLPAVIAALVSTSYLGPDVGIFRWAVFSTVGVTVATIIGAALAGTGVWSLQLLFVFLVFTALGTMLLAGITTQAAFLPIATVGIIMTVLYSSPVTMGLVISTILGASWGLLLIATMPRWSGWPRLPLPPGGLKPDTDLLKRLWTSPSWRDWSFPLLLGALAALVLVIADLLGQGERPYWAVLALVTILGPQRQKTLDDGLQTLIAALIGVTVGIGLLRLPLPLPTVLAIGVALGALGALVIISHPLWSKTLMSVLIVVIFTVVAGDDPSDIGHERFIEIAIGATTAILAAGLAEYLALRMEQRHPEPIDPPDSDEDKHASSPGTSH